MKNFIFRIATLLIIIVISYLAYYTLLYDKVLNISIPRIIHYAHGLTIDKHIIILGLLPIYIGIMIFGATWLGAFAGHKIQQLFNRPSKLRRLAKK